jgi:hypothetical protein
MVTTGVPLVLTAGVTGALPGGSNYYSSGSQSGFQEIGLGRVLLSEGGAAAPDSGMTTATPSVPRLTGFAQMQFGSDWIGHNQNRKTLFPK